MTMRNRTSIKKWTGRFTSRGIVKLGTRAAKLELLCRVARNHNRRNLQTSQPPTPLGAVGWEPKITIQDLMCFTGSAMVTFGEVEPRVKLCMPRLTNFRLKINSKSNVTIGVC